MFNRTRKYFYGSTDEHVIDLRPAEADAVNKLLIMEVEGKPGYFRTNLTDAEMAAYSRAATKLNAYLETHSVYCSDEDAENGNILRPVK